MNGKPNAGTNQHENENQARWEQISRQGAAEARRRRNFDRAVLIAARLQFEGIVSPQGESKDFYDHEFENAVKAILDMLERFDLDSPNGEIVDVFKGKR